MAKTTLVVILIIIIVGTVAGYLFYTNYVQGTVTLRVVDPPPNGSPYGTSIQHVYVTFTKFEIHEAGGANDSGWHTITGASTTVDLVSVVSTPQTIASARLTSGRYDQIRFFASTATVTTLGVNSTLTIPSANQTGIKVVISNGGLQVSATSNTTVQLTLQFDTGSATFTVVKADVI